MWQILEDRDDDFRYGKTNHGLKSGTMEPSFYDSDKLPMFVTLFEKIANSDKTSPYSPLKVVYPHD